jgi:nicotinamide-nucleotide amidase
MEMVMRRLFGLFLPFCIAVLWQVPVFCESGSRGEVKGEVGESSGQTLKREAPAIGPQPTPAPPAEAPSSPNRLRVRAEIVAIGDELCYGRVYDTNSFWIADQVTRRGVLIQRIVCVRDDLDDISAALKEALSRKPRFIFITGGLGHTDDDKTRHALSAVTGRKIVRRPDMMESIAKWRNVTAERLPAHFWISTSSVEGAICLPNPAGVSPVTIIKEGSTEIVALPGPPREVYACFAAHLADKVQAVTGYHSLSRRVIIPMHESEVTPLMTTLMREIPGTYVKALVGQYRDDPGMPIEIMAFGPTEEICDDLCGRAMERLRQLAAEKGRKMIQLPADSE